MGRGETIRPPLGGSARAADDGPASAGFAQAVLRGDEELLASAIRHHLPRLLGYLTRLGGDPGLAEDIAQETLLRAVLACRRGDPPRRLGTWLYAVATNLWRDVARSAERRRTTPGLPADAPGRDATDAAVDASLVRLALARLPRELRVVLVLHFYEGFAQREIALATGAPLGTVKWRMHMALRRMRALLGPEFGGSQEGQR